MTKLVASVVFLAWFMAAAPQDWEKVIGTWRMTSDLSPFPGMKIEANSDGTLTVSECKPDGTTCRNSVTYRYDGKAVKDAGPDPPMVQFRKLGDRTMEVKSERDGKLTMTQKCTVSPDGATLTVKSEMASSEIRKNPVANTSTMIRKEGPASGSDPFVGFWLTDMSREAYQQTYKRKGDYLELTDSAGLNLMIPTDGKDRLIHPEPGQDLIMSTRFTDAYTMESVFKDKDGKVLWTSTRVYSEDGKRVRSIRTGPDGQVMSTVTLEKVE